MISGWDGMPDRSRFRRMGDFVVVSSQVDGGNKEGTHKGCPYRWRCQRSPAVSCRCPLTTVVEDAAVVFGPVDVEEEGVGLDDVDGDAGLGGEALVAEEAVAAEGEGDGLGRLEHEGVGAAVAAGGDGDLGFGAAGGGHCADVAGCEVGHVGGEDEEFGCAVGGGVAGGLGQGGVELWFGLGVVGGAGLAFFGQGAAAGAFCRVEGVGVAAYDEDFGVEVGLVDGCEGAGEEFAVEGAALLGGDVAGEAAFAFVEGFDGDDGPQAHLRIRLLESSGYTFTWGQKV